MTNPPQTDDNTEGMDNWPVDMLVAFIHRHGGEKAVRKALTESDWPPKTFEDYEDVALELERHGLDHVAAVIWDMASKFPSKIERTLEAIENETDPIRLRRLKGRFTGWLIHRTHELGVSYRELCEKYSLDRSHSQFWNTKAPPRRPFVHRG